jgi:hypothetical protein
MRTPRIFDRLPRHAAVAALACLSGSLAIANPPHKADPLELGFASPPFSAKPWVYWYWQHCNLTKEGITADLEDMKRRGIGGVLIMDAAEGVPMGLTYDSPEYWAMVDFAVREAARLGLQINVQNCPSWSGSGGPWVIPGQAMQAVVTSETMVHGPAALNLRLPQPPVMPVTVPKGNRDVTIRYYKDIAVIAFKTPAIDQVPFGEQVKSVTTSGNQPVASPAVLFDQNPETSVQLPPAAEPYLQFELKQPATVQSLSLKLVRPFDEVGKIVLQASDDGSSFRDVIGFPPSKNREGQFVRNPSADSERSDIDFPPVTARFLRLVFDCGGSQGSVITVGDAEFHAGPRITDLSTKAGYQRRAGATFDPAPVATPDGGAIDKGSVRDLTSDLQANGRLAWEAPPGNWTILRFGSTLVPSTNQEAPLAGRGLESDKLSRDALTACWDNGFLKKLITVAGPQCGKTFTMVHIDSYEEDCQNWTPAFRAEFTRRRHYDPLPYFPVLTGRIVESVPVSERFLWDYRRTLADLIRDNWYGYLTEYAHEYGLETSTEPYGCGNFDWFEAGGAVDVPSSEFWGGEHFSGADKLDIKRPPSSGHTYGKPIINSEAFTSQPFASKFLNDPYRLKDIGDSAFCLGVNRLVFHTYVAQPWTNLEPGMTFGPWGTAFGRTNTWWEMGTAWIDYLTRCQFLLQQGHFKADVCVFEGENEVPGYGADSRADITPDIPDGYDYDLCDKKVVLDRMSVKNGRIVLPDGMSYRFLLLAQRPGKPVAMTPEVLAKLRSLVQDGATLIGRRPTLSPSLDGYPACDAEVAEMAGELWGDCDGVHVKEHPFGEGKVIDGETFQEIAGDAALPPDFGSASANPGLQLNWIHRYTAGGADIYFVANQNIAPADATCQFRVSRRQPEFWHPDTGRIEDCAQFSQDGSETSIPIHFDSKGSVFVIFRRPAMADPIVAVHPPEALPKPPLTLTKATLHYADKTSDMTAELAGRVSDGSLDIGVNHMFGAGPWDFRSALDVEYQSPAGPDAEHLFGFESFHLPVEDIFAADTPYQVKQTPAGPAALVETSGTYTFDFASGKTRTLAVDVPAPLPVTGPWEVHFQPGRGAPDHAVFDQLMSWPDDSDPGIKYFSGTATYLKKFDLPAGLITEGRRLYLDLGRVEVMAEVTLNGKDLGVLWKPPFREDITGYVKPGTNDLQVKVVNLWPNRLIGDEQFPDDARWTRHWGGMQLADWPAWLAHGIPTGQRPATGRVAFATWKHWKKDDPLLKSGLLGPVTIQVAEQRILK